MPAPWAQGGQISVVQSPGPSRPSMVKKWIATSTKAARSRPTHDLPHDLDIVSDFKLRSSTYIRKSEFQVSSPHLAKILVVGRRLSTVGRFEARSRRGKRTDLPG